MSQKSSIGGNTISKLVIASHNRGKAKEIEALLAPFSLDVISAGDLNIEDPEETELTFSGNALLKARHCMAACHLPCLADDSGLVIPALNGEPGIYSARWAEVHPNSPRDFNHAMSVVEQKLQGRQGVDAYMICVLCLILPDGEHHLFEGRVEGVLVFPGRGPHGFGYDPIFQPNGYDKTFGEMTTVEKYKISHRTLAFNKMIDTVFGSDRG